MSVSVDMDVGMGGCLGGCVGDLFSESVSKWVGVEGEGGAEGSRLSWSIQPPSVCVCV